jgi:hypothetical protein
VAHSARPPAKPRARRRAARSAPPSNCLDRFGRGNPQPTPS